jgi:hypothetical protein
MAAAARRLIAEAVGPTPAPGEAACARVGPSRPATASRCARDRGTAAPLRRAARGRKMRRDRARARARAGEGAGDGGGRGMQRRYGAKSRTLVRRRSAAKNPARARSILITHPHGVPHSRIPHPPAPPHPARGPTAGGGWGRGVGAGGRARQQRGRLDARTGVGVGVGVGWLRDGAEGG